MEKRFHGYLVLPRQAKLLHQELGYELFGFYLMLVMEAIWHRGNRNFGKVVGTQAELARNLHIDQSTISRNLKKLELHKYYVVRRKQGYILLGYFPLFLQQVASRIHSNNYVNLSSLYADMYRINAELQERYVNMQGERGKKAPLILYSSSNERSSSGEVDEDYLDIDAIDIGIETMKRE